MHTNEEADDRKRPADLDWEWWEKYGDPNGCKTFRAPRNCRNTVLGAAGGVCSNCYPNGIQPSAFGSLRDDARHLEMAVEDMRKLQVRLGETSARIAALEEQRRGPTPVHTPTNVAHVPNKPKTPVTGFRIPEDVKAAAVERAEAEGKTLTDVVVRHLRRYGAKHKRSE